MGSTKGSGTVLLFKTVPDYLKEAEHQSRFQLLWRKIPQIIRI
jgi:hypothetical protein